MDYSKIMQFKGTWRNYQARVLANSMKYLEDGKVHIVAAPGSGKTTLGIELISRIGEPALILAPSITIREQWVSRIVEGFMKEGVDPSNYISQDLRDPRVITVITYQSLHSAINRFRGTICEEGEMSEGSDDVNPYDNVEVDYSNFDIVKTMKECRLGVLCLDECHHLRSEWWKALEDFKNAIGQCKVIALTATPPYDSTPAMWDRYMNMCGPIDEEIAIPELVKEGSLCPHQDYAFFNYPTDDEAAVIEEYEARAKKKYEELMSDEDFKTAIGTHAIFRGVADMDKLLDKPANFSALLIFAKERGIPFAADLQRILGTSSLPRMDMHWMEALLTGFLYEDCESYAVDNTYREQLMAAIKAEGLIEKKQISFVTNAAVEKLLLNSKGKIESICKISNYEYTTFREKLRLLVLTDYIKKEYEKCLGDPEADVTALGVLPLFEKIRRYNNSQTLRLGVLCGTIVIIPASAKEALVEAVGDANKITFSPVGKLPETDYVKVNAIGDNHFLTGAVTKIFEAGYMQILIGTKSLLGEGWDSPCINSLILASFVGSFMLSNQMRGRAIRVFKQDPKKSSNIWHLVCLPPSVDKVKVKEGLAEVSEDYALLERRMGHFLGLHYSEDIIENGIDRLSFIEAPFDRANVERINDKMLELSSKRGALANRWNNALVQAQSMEVVEETSIPAEKVPKVGYKNTRNSTIKTLATGGAIFAIGAALTASGVGIVPGIVMMGAGGVTGLTGARKIPLMLQQSTDPKRLRMFGRGIHNALSMEGLFEDPNSHVQVSQSGTNCNVFLEGGTTRDKELFTKCVKEVFGPIENQRYLLVKNSFIKDENSFYCVPECFGKKKEDAQMFYERIKPFIGNYNLIYTRNEEGRKLLLDGRVKCIANKIDRAKTHKCLSRYE